jgi:hypothetical protein
MRSITKSAVVTAIAGLFLAVAVAACGDDSSSADAAIDAPATIDGGIDSGDTVDASVDAAP